MKTLLTTLLLGSFISAPLFANEQANEYLEERSHNQHHNVTSNNNASSQVMMQNHRQMMTKMHQVMPENGCANMMKNMEKTES